MVFNAIGIPNHFTSGVNFIQKSYPQISDVKNMELSKNFFYQNKRHFNQPGWPSSLRRHAISQLIVAPEGPGFKSQLGITILIAQK